MFQEKGKGICCFGFYKHHTSKIMNLIVVRNALIDLAENVGVIVDDSIKHDSDVDCKLLEMITDSIQWISFIVSIESYFEIEWPDELLQADSFNSLNSLSQIVLSIIGEKEYNSLC